MDCMCCGVALVATRADGMFEDEQDIKCRDCGATNTIAICEDGDDGYDVYVSFWRCVHGCDHETQCAACDAISEAEHHLINVPWWWTLGHNFAAIGALFASFRAGDNYGFHMGEDSAQCGCQWYPSSGKPYVGATACENDPDPADPDDDSDECQHCDYGCESCDPNVAAAAIERRRGNA